MSTLADRIKLMRQELALTQTELGERAGVGKAAVSLWEDGSTKTLKAEVAISLQAKTGYSAHWIVTGNGPKLAGVGNTSLAQDLKVVPLISWVQAGDWEDAVDNYRPGEGEEPVYTTRKVGPHAYALRVEGDSMENPNGRPSYPQGAKIVVDPDLAPQHGSAVVVRLESSQMATFKILMIEGGRKYLKPLNPRYPIIEVNSNATFCGVVVQTIIDE